MTKLSTKQNRDIGTKKTQGSRTKSIISISDIHLNIRNQEYLEYQLFEIFVKYCIQEQPDLIVISGDLYDSRISLASPAAKCSFKLIKTLYDSTNANILIIEGTFLHDHFQIAELKSIENKGSKRILIVEKVSVIYVSGLKILCIPEEAVEDKYIYYNNYLQDNYDIVFGHGTFDHVGFTPKLNRNIKHTPIWSYKDFEKITPLVIFGHIHTSSFYKNLVLYNGSFTRWHFDEEEDKGFWHILHNKRNIERIFVKNTLAPKYMRIKLSDCPTKDLPEYIQDFVKDYDRLDRLQILLDVKKDDIRRKELGIISKIDKIYLLERHINRKNIETAHNIEANRQKLEDLQQVHHIDYAVNILKKHDKNIDKAKINSLLDKE